VLGVDAVEQPFGRRKNAIDPGGEDRRRQAHLLGELDPEELGIAFRVPAVDGAAGEGDRRRARRAEPAQLFLRFRISLGVDGVELDPPRREQLLRLGTGRSARPVEDSRSIHRSLLWIRSPRTAGPQPRDVLQLALHLPLA
jgi:hypothetical protein